MSKTQELVAAEIRALELECQRRAVTEDELTRRLEKATTLLETCEGAVNSGTGEAIRAFLSRAPAVEQPGTSDTDLIEGLSESLSGTSARAESAEATLAAVRAIWTTYSRPETEGECVSPGDAMRHIGRALHQVDTITSAQPGSLLSNAGVRAATAELEARRLEGLLADKELVLEKYAELRDRVSQLESALRTEDRLKFEALQELDEVRATIAAATSAPQHPDSALLDRIAEDFRQCVGEHVGNSLEFALRVRSHLRTRAAGQSGGGQ
jgi:hypothetical protein